MEIPFPLLSRTYSKIFITLATCLVAIVLRAQYIDFHSFDFDCYTGWIDHIRKSGLSKAYGESISNYAPLQNYFLGLLDALLGNPPSIYVIKGLSFIGEGFAAYWTYRITALYYQNKPDSLMPLFSVAALLVCPSVITNGSITGQCDIWLAAFMLAALYYSMRRRSIMALVYGSLAFSFKPQSVFMAPLLLILVLRKDISWKYLWIIPAVYLAVCIPAWLEGRSMEDLLTIYWSQIGGYLNYNAGNPYAYFYDSEDIVLIRIGGQVFAICIAVWLVVISYIRWKAPINPQDCILMATLFATIIPYMLPGMHDRYFFMADIFSLAWACMRPRWFILPILLQSASLMVQPGYQIPQLNGVLGWVQSLGVVTAIWINVTAVCICLWLCYKNIWKNSHANRHLERQFN